jgi:hypothetical protein
MPQLSPQVAVPAQPGLAQHTQGHGWQVSFIVERAARAPNYTEWMKRRVDSDTGKAMYSQRMTMVEPVFASIGIDKGLNRFSLRDRRKVQGQRQLYCLVHNIGKLKNYGKWAV